MDESSSIRATNCLWLYIKHLPTMVKWTDMEIVSDLVAYSTISDADKFFEPRSIMPPGNHQPNDDLLSDMSTLGVEFAEVV